ELGVWNLFKVLHHLLHPVTPDQPKEGLVRLRKHMVIGQVYVTHDSRHLVHKLVWRVVVNTKAKRWVLAALIEHLLSHGLSPQKARVPPALCPPSGPGPSPWAALQPGHVPGLPAILRRRLAPGSARPSASRCTAVTPAP